MYDVGAALASYSLAVRVTSRPFPLDLQCVCEQHLLRLVLVRVLHPRGG